MQIFKTLTDPKKLVEKSKLGLKGPAGFIAATVALETATQLLDRFVLSKYFPSGQGIMNTQVLQSAPFLGPVNVRDGIVLLPAATQAAKGITGKDKQKHLINAGVAYATKIILRRTGLNPDEIAKKAEKAVSPQQIMLPQVM